MTFLNLALLGGVTAFSIPLVIHLLNKRKFKTVYWGATHLLEDILKKNNRRIRVEQFLLLLLRISIPILLALCLARPVLTKLQAWLGDEKTSSLILVDQSYSMEAPASASGAGESLIEQAKIASGQILEKLPRGSDGNILYVGATPRPLLDEPTTALDLLPRKLSESTPPADESNMPQAVRAGLTQIQKMTHPAREMVLLTDLRAQDWQGATPLSMASALEEFTQQNDLQAPKLTIVNLASPDAPPPGNLSVHSLSLSSLILATHQKFALRATIKNHGDSTRADIPVYFYANGQQIRSSKIQVPAHAETQVLFTHSFPTIGEHHVEIRLEGDAIKADDSYHAIIPVWETVNTLLIEGAPGKGPLEGDTDFLEIALQPFTTSRASDPSLNDLIKTQKILSQDLGRHHLREGNKPKVAILANAPSLQGNQRHELREWVKEGGSLVIFLGDRTDLRWWNDHGYEDGNGILPVQIQGLTRSGANIPPARLVNQRHTHPALDFFNDPRNGVLSDIEFRAWYRLSTPETSSSNKEGIRTLLSLDQGDPWMIEKTLGEGRILLIATPADADWSNLPTQPAYLPLAQRLVTYLASSVNPPHNLRVGEPLRVFSPKEKAMDRILIDPNGQEQRINPISQDQSSLIEVLNTHQPGVYTLLPIPGQDQLPQRFAFNYQRNESDLTPLSPEEIPHLKNSLQNLNVEVVNGLDQYFALDKVRRFGQEIWKPILWILLIFLFAEILLQQFLAKRTF